MEKVSFDKVCVGSEDTIMDGKQFYTLETLMKHAGVTHIALLKMDIEGWEMNVFDSMPAVPPDAAVSAIL